MINVVRNNSLAKKVVFVDGLPGCGKTLFSTLISAMERVELLSYTYEIEHICQLFYLDKITIDAAKTMVSLQTDLRIYHTMMGRDVNFRPSDLSSVIKYHNPLKYFQRIFQDGDETIPSIIEKENPVLNFSVHNMLAYSGPVWDALGDRCVFIENLGMNLGGCITSSQLFSLYFQKQGYGNIINISSIYGVISPKFEIYKNTSMTMPVEYAAIKSGLIHLTKYMAKYFKGMNIRVNAISPGGIIDGQSDSFLREYNMQCLTKGMLDKNDLNGTLVYLLCSMSKYVNGQNIVVDDGFSV